MTALTELRVRVAGLTGSDRNVDVAVYCIAHDGWLPDRVSGFAFKDTGSAALNDRMSGSAYLHSGRTIVPQYTKSVDAVLALIERKLPGACDILERLPAPEPIWSAMLWDTRGVLASAVGPTRPLAYLLTLLDALLSNPIQVGEETIEDGSAPRGRLAGAV